MIRLLVFTLAFAVTSAALAAQQPSAASTPTPTTPTPVTGFVTKTLSLDDREHRYVVYVPADYRADRRWPLVLFLHGMGECGTDGKRHLDVGLGPAIRAEPGRWPCIVVLPQKPDRGSQWTEHERLVLAMLAATEAEYAIDPTRRYLTGLSQGGSGTWLLGAKHQERWAAIAPVCGYGKPDDVKALRATPIWAFHGEDDKVVPSQQSKDLCAAAAAAGCKPLLTLYPGVGHNSWDRAYRDEALPEWLLAEPADRLGVYYVADGGRVQTAKLVARTGPAAATAAAPWVSLTLESNGTNWSVVANTTTRTGSMAVEPGRVFVADQLRRLWRAGLLTLPMTVAAGEPSERRVLRVALELTGSGGSWQCSRESASEATSDPSGKAVRSVLEECAKALAEMR